MGPPPPSLQGPSLSLGVPPIPSHADTYNKRHAQAGGRFHMAFYQLSRGFLLRFGDLKYKLVWYLQDQARCEPARGERAGDANHGDLDHVRCRPLQRRVGRRALPERPDVEVPILEFGDIARPAEQGLDIPPLPRLGHRPIEPRPHPREACEVLPDELLRLVLRDPELARQGEGPLSVDGAEVDGLGAGPHLRRDLVLRHAEDDRRCLAVYVPALLERLEERGVPRGVRD